MMTTGDLADVTVGRFWQDFNWSGRPPKLAEPERKEREPTNWLEFNLAEFLDRANWSGRKSIEPRPVPVLDAPVLTWTVEDYFRSLPWRGEPGSLPAPTAPRSPSVQPPKREEHDFNATDLSNLF
ncbi:hypothetical protein V0288_13610 [Pannus brasiliensis CCIBt3594]|uniref:Uncharacterized protein n=1 Tax=Pannus brasiliensis CCIBt3594 TaxID=1427578 RepID=A0AAW9QSG9_9CHRO